MSGLGRLIPPPFRPRVRSAVSDLAEAVFKHLNPGKIITNGPFTWDHHGLAARTSDDWQRDPDFARAHDQSWTEIEAFGLFYKKRDRIFPITRNGFHNEWNMHTACVFAKWALALPEGDFVEIGSGAGFFSRCLMRYLDFDKTDRRFWLVDRWSPDTIDHLLSDSERKNTVSLYIDSIDVARRIFSPYKNARLVQGVVPNCLPLIGADKIAFLYIDLNAAEPERAALEYLWPRVAPGGFVLSDDFGFISHKPQREMFQSFCAEHGLDIFYCPTGQGIVQKPV